MSAHFSDGQQHIKLVIVIVILIFMCVQLSVTTTSNIAQVKVHAPMASTCVKLGQRFRQSVGRDLASEHF